MKNQTKGQTLAWSIRPFITLPPKSSSDVDIVVSDIGKSIDKLLEGKVTLELEKEDLMQWGEYYGLKIIFPDGSVFKFRIQEHEFDGIKKKYAEPEKHGSFNRDETYKTLVVS